ncbi:hypothetical protein ASF74_14865 [Arthrobacter sp. Leaf145]|nr:hypothetical protein ASF74_14865 [Arthrobacter sp. Leaf145]
MSEQASGISFASALGLVFIVLKLTGVIAWSWWWVLAPFWIPIAIGLIFMLVLIIIDWVDGR